jgi:hypothetical protein
MREATVFDEAGEPSDAPGRFPPDDLDPLTVIPGLEFRPVTTDSVMTNFVSSSRVPPLRCITTSSSRSRSSSRES